MSEHGHEPVRGFPGHLPPDEHILWQGSPDWRVLVASALHVRLCLAYFGGLAIWAALQGSLTAALILIGSGIVVIALFGLYAYATTQSTVYSLTNKRVVMRIGVALDACINLPLGEIESADLKILGNGRGNIVLSLKGIPRIGYWMLWPHVRSLRMIRPQPMLRAVPDARDVAQLLFKATQGVQQVAPRETGQLVPERGVLAGAAA
jgi:hypothetical protein